MDTVLDGLAFAVFVVAQISAVVATHEAVHEATRGRRDKARPLTPQVCEGSARFHHG
jgi:hypothetical protein